LAGLRVSAEDLLAALLKTAAKPTRIVDPDDVIRVANPAAVVALGYDCAEELLGHENHGTIGYPDGAPYSAAECPLRLPLVAASDAVTSDLAWFFQRDGTPFAASFASVPIATSEGRGAVAASSMSRTD
jgi:PAS domain-containing protein